jgi:hypothetical protein
MKPSDPDAAKLLRWYPRPWRERYGALAATQFSLFQLLLGVVALATQSVGATVSIRRALRRGRRLRARPARAR